MDKKRKFCFCWLDSSKLFERFVTKLWLSYLGRTNQWCKDDCFCWNYFVYSLGVGKMYPAAVFQIPTQTNDWNQSFKRQNFQKQPQLINKMIRSWYKKIIRDLQRDFPKWSHGFLFWLLSSKTISPSITLAFGSFVAPKGSLTQNWWLERVSITLKYVICMYTNITFKKT